VGSGSVIKGVETRNGAVEIATQARVNGQVETRNGQIKITDASVSQGVITRNGRVQLEGVLVTGDVQSRNGKIEIDGASRIDGDVVIDLSDLQVSGRSFGVQTELEIVIGGDTEVIGSVVLRLPKEDRSHHTGTVRIGHGVSVLGEVVVTTGVITDLQGQIDGGLVVEE
jgi:hypothetical protein